MPQGSGWTENVLVKRLLFTLLALLVFRFGVHIPVPGIDAKELALFASQQGAGLLKIFNMFSGGALSHFSIFSLAVMPYISASIIIQLMTVVVPSLEQMQKEGGVGRQKITRITRSLSVLLALVQAYLLSAGLEASRGPNGGMIVLDPGLSFRLMSCVLMAAGSCFVMWLGEQITDKGIGNGISLLIFAGIVAYLPSSANTIIEMVKQNSGALLGALGIVAFALLLVFAVTFFEQSYRKVPIHYAKRLVGKRVMSAQATHLPLKVNMAGIMAAIFASTILAVPATFLSFGSAAGNVWLADFLPGHWLYNAVFVVLGMFFSFFYASIVFKSDDVAENLKKQNAYIPGVRPGSETAEALDTVVTRLTFAGAIYMNLIVVVPSLIGSAFSQQMTFGGTSLLIVVGVGLEAIRQVRAQLATQKYDFLIFPSQSRDTTTANNDTRL
ncbi:preprotein translocase subunit SecY [Silvanigrella paludirubra]|jgi:preprotein translocase subunit SecY|uniref:Protein translocase subunit SecY n=1 Tax=Silvanigrella paludirubra TaxID=2499159 RepID=A0A6N6VQH4_9BACT|nr:preprotein translocase subunit SecY [Silvanigrella paludirubra]KAB8037592.1 preprotein translocase subunit SecY [Silvanigrella paludirubra]